MKILFAFFLLILIGVFAFAHEGESQQEEAIFASNPVLGFIHDHPALDFLVYGFAAALAILLFSVFLKRQKSEQYKKISYVLVVLLIAAPSLYLALSTVYENIASASGGPIHWHADYEIWVCGKKLELIESDGFDNKVGSAEVHMHNDSRIHVEGTLMSLNEASLGYFFRQIGGEMADTSLSVPLHDKTIGSWKNGDICPDGHAGKWKMMVNNVEKDFSEEYVISPYSNVPPGDYIKLVFG